MPRYAQGRAVTAATYQEAERPACLPESDRNRLDGVPAERATAAATLLQGAGWGLLLDQVATRDHGRIDLAWEELMGWLEAIVHPGNAGREPVTTTTSAGIGAVRPQC